MTEHRDVTGIEIIAAEEAVNEGGFSLASTLALIEHMTQEHAGLENEVTEFIVKKRHQVAILTGKIDAAGLAPNIDLSKHENS